MSFVESSVLNKLSVGSLEHKRFMVEQKAEEKGCKDVAVVATFFDHAIVLCDKGKFFKAKFEEVDGFDVVFEEFDLPVVEDIDCLISKELSEVSEKMMKGEEISRNRLRDLSRLIKENGVFWLSDVVKSLREDREDDWLSFHNENRDDIRDKLKGKIIETENRVPRTRFSKLSDKRLTDCGTEVKESINVLLELFKEVVDESNKIMFDNSNEVFETIKNSLIGDAKNIDESLSKAKRLMLSEVTRVMAETHDWLSERAKKMVIVSEFLKLNQTVDNKNQNQE